MTWQTAIIDDGVTSFKYRGADPEAGPASKRQDVNPVLLYLADGDTQVQEKEEHFVLPVITNKLRLTIHEITGYLNWGRWLQRLVRLDISKKETEYRFLRSFKLGEQKKEVPKFRGTFQDEPEGACARCSALCAAETYLSAPDGLSFEGKEWVNRWRPHFIIGRTIYARQTPNDPWLIKVIHKIDASGRPICATAPAIKLRGSSRARRWRLPT